jgi:hypothetical protein
MSEHGVQTGRPAGGGPPGDASPTAHNASPTAHDAAPIEMSTAAPDVNDGSPIEMSLAARDVPGDADPEAAKPSARSRRTRAIVLSSLLAVGVAGAAVLGVAGWRIASQQGAKISLPSQVAGLALDNSESASSTADYLRTALSAEVELNDPVGGVYADPAAKNRSVLFFGGTNLIWSPDDVLDAAFNLITDDTGSVTGVREVPPGPLGGAMRCGTTTTSDGDIAVCGWADHGSLALAMFPNRSMDESAKLLRTIRDGVQTRD